MIAQDSRQRAEGGIRHPWPSLRVQMMRKWERKSSVHLKITLNWITYTLVYNYMDRASTRLLRLSVCRYRQQRNIPVPTLSLSVEKVSFINVFQHVEEPLTFDLDLVSTCFCGKNNWSCTDHSSFTDCDQTQFCCHHSEFSPFCLLNITQGILFSGSFHLLQDTGYRVWSPSSHTKCSVSVSTWYWWLHYWGNIYW